MGLRRIVTPVDHECVFNGVGERFRHRPWGLAGGLDGASGQFRIRDAAGERRLDDKPGEVKVGTGTRIIVETPGAGGYGDPAGRDTGALATDEASGKFSRGFLEDNYPAAPARRR